MLISGASKTVKEYSISKNLGILLTPNCGNGMNYVLETNLPWAADNGCFTGFNPPKYIKMLEKIRNKPKLIYVTCPDVVGNVKETLDYFKEWEPILHSQYNLPVALVGQDGLENYKVPWDKFEAFFIGGTTEWKLSEEARKLTQKAIKLNKWVHMGRVNSFKRIKYAIEIGCHSIDGSSYSKFPNTYIPKTLDFLKEME